MMMAPPNPGYSAGLGQTSKLRRLAWAWKGADVRTIEQAKTKNIKERRLSPMDAVLEARELSENISAKLRKNGIDRKDAAVGLVFAKKENLGKLAGVVVFETPDPDADSKDLEFAAAHIRHVPIGFLVAVLDREKREFISHARPLILQDAPLKLLETMVEDVAKLKDWRLS
jgi:hypothetical protein